MLLNFQSCLFILRESCKKLAVDNEKLHETLFQSEKDTIDVITYMKKGELEKDDKVGLHNSDSLCTGHPTITQLFSDSRT